MAIIHIDNAADLAAGDRVVFAPFNVPFFKNDPETIVERDGLIGFVYGEDDTFFPVTTPDGGFIPQLVLVDATRDVVIREKEENIGQEVRSASDLPALYGVPVILRHEEHGDYRGFASNDDVDGWETVRLIEDMGHGSFGFWRSGGFTIHLAVGIDMKYNL